MRICHIITRMIIGGAQENTLYTCQGHLEKGHEVTLLTGPTTGPEGKLLERSCPKGLKVVEIPDLIRELSPLHDWRAYRALKAYLKAHPMDVVHTHASKAGILGRIAAKKAGVPFVCHTVHGQAFHPYQSSWKNRLYIASERLAAKYCDRIYAVAQAMVDQCVAARIAPRDKYQVVYSGMDLASFSNALPDNELRNSLGLSEGTPVIGTVARLFPLKGYEDLLEAIPYVIKEVPDVKVLIVGNGILRKSLEEQAQRLGIQNHLIFAGLIPPTEVCRYTALMDVLAHLSLREGLPRAVVQALASGVPAVAYPLDGTPEVITNGETGFLCPVHDISAVANALIKLLKDGDLRRKCGAAGQALVLKRFDWRHMSDVLEQEYLKNTAT